MVQKGSGYRHKNMFPVPLLFTFVYRNWLRTASSNSLPFSQMTYNGDFIRCFYNKTRSARMLIAK